MQSGIKSNPYRNSVFLTLIFSTQFLFSQIVNLVPNPSFEQYNFLPSSARQGLKCAATWKNPSTSAQGDYYHVNSQTKHYRIKRNVVGSQDPHTGNAYAGICITKKFREYLQVELLKPLEKGRQYRVSIFISCADKIYFAKVKEFNVLFSKKTVMFPDNEYLNGSPAIRFRNEDKYKDKKGWVELSALYTAFGDEKVMTFGSFMYKERILAQTKVNGEIYGPIKYAHYYVDDISITSVQPDTPMQVAQEKDDTISVVDFIIGKTYVFKNIQFETAKAELLPKAFPELEKLISYLKKNTNTRLVITGHTDNVGTGEDNQKLSYARAKTIKRYLVSNGINETLLSIEGKGDQFPIASNDTEEGREQNRRVEISFF